MDARQYVVSSDGLLVSVEQAAKSGDPKLEAQARRIVFDMEAVRKAALEQQREAAKQAAVKEA